MNGRITFDVARVQELIEEYEETEGWEDRRTIEDEILRETVWDGPNELLRITEGELRMLKDAIPEDDDHGQMVARWVSIRDKL